MIALDHDLRSAGQLVVDLRIPHAALLRTIVELGIDPSLILNGVAYFDGASQTKIAAALAPHPRPARGEGSNP